MLAGMMFFTINHEGEYKPERMVKNLRKESALKVREIGRRYQDLGRKRDEGFYLAILDIYNKGLRDELKLTPKKCDWRTVKAARKRHEAEEQRIRRTNR